MRRPPKQVSVISSIGFSILVILIVAACGLKSIEVSPPDAELYLNGIGRDAAEIASEAGRGDTIVARREGYHELRYTITRDTPRELTLALAPYTYTLSLSIRPFDAELYIDGERRDVAAGDVRDAAVAEGVEAGGAAAAGAPAEGGRLRKDRFGSASVELPYGEHVIEVKKSGFETVRRTLLLNEGISQEIRLMSEGSHHEFIAELDTGVWPKQVVFSPDGESIVVPLLKGEGIDIIDFESRTVSRYVIPGYGRQRYFPDGLFSDDGSRFFLSQMPSDKIHVLTFPGPEYVTSFDTGGVWSKVIVFSPDRSKLLVSNWVSNDVTVFDAESLELERTLSYDARTPRGLAFTPDGKYLFITYYDSGHIVKARVEDWMAVHSFATGGANRDVIVDSRGETAYVSNMAHGVVYIIDVETDSITATIEVGRKPNTIRLTPDEEYLYVSCRGPNNPVDYELPSPEDGDIYVIDTADLDIVEVIPGGNQPTGLDISPDGEYLVFSNFQDNNVEIYRIML